MNTVFFFISAFVCVLSKRKRKREKERKRDRDRTEIRVLSLSLSHLNGAHCEYFRGILMKFICVRAQNYPSDQSFWARLLLLQLLPPFHLPLPLLTCVTNALLKLDFKLAKNAA